IALIDYAIRRRFDFIELQPDRTLLGRYLQEQHLTEGVQRRALVLFDAVAQLFESGQQDFAVGHTYFMGVTADDIARKFVFQLAPLLREYQKEGILSETVSVVVEGWPGASGIPLKSTRPFELVAELKTWLSSGDEPTAALPATHTAAAPANEQ